MAAPLLALMAYRVVGDALHEWFGAGMLVLFIVHNILNYKRYASFFKGRYKPQRVFSAMVTIAVLAAMVTLGYSGIGCYEMFSLSSTSAKEWRLRVLCTLPRRIGDLSL